jgi:nitroimidazol reductase NimA-like FMN-containing flavoprotein (pyridoxamine 5'-phosphate oxidase superfamily)
MTGATGDKDAAAIGGASVREMRRRDKRITDSTTLQDLINKAKVCRVAMCDGDEPYVVPLSFGFDGADLYFHSATAGRKVDILKANDRVCLEFEDGEDQVQKTDRPCNWSVKYFSVIASGRAELVTDTARKTYGLNQIIRHYQPDAPEHRFAEQELGSIAVYRVALEHLTGKRSV